MLGTYSVDIDIDDVLEHVDEDDLKEYLGISTKDEETEYSIEDLVCELKSKILGKTPHTPNEVAEAISSWINSNMCNMI